jgi:N-acetylglucosaminyldiphosphoundecaprenol N-acetyl-beta-D-mannosaminyltransferase
MERRPPSVCVLGSQVDLVKLPHVLARMENWIHHPDGICHRITVTGFHGLWWAYKDSRVRDALNSADLWVPDGIAPVWVARLKGIKDAHRLPGIDLMEGFLARANEKGYRSFFYGDTEETLRCLREKMESCYPQQKLTGMFSPPYRPLTPEEDRQIVEMINAAKPDVLWVALGLPKQDLWLFDHKDRLTVPVAVGVGAAFGFLAGTVRRVPKRIGDAGFEWAWRFAMEPRKVWRRGFLEAPQFVVQVALELVGIRRHDHHAYRRDTGAEWD